MFTATVQSLKEGVVPIFDITTATGQSLKEGVVPIFDITTAWSTFWMYFLYISKAIEQLDISTAIEQLLKVEVVPSCRSVLIDSALTDVKLLL